MKTNQDIAMELAHRTCTKYLHVPDSSSIQYSFSARHLADFVEKLVAAVDAERGKDAVGYDEIFNAIAEAASPCGEGIGVSVMAFKRAIGGEIFLSPTIPEGMALVPIEPTLDMGWAYLDAARESSPECEHVFNHPGYRAMLQAAGVTK